MSIAVRLNLRLKILMLASVLAAAGIAAPCGAQNLRVRVELEHLIGEEDDAEEAQLLRGVSSITIGPNDQIYLHQGNANTIYVYSADGGYLHALGSPGRGPGEFGLVRSVIPVPEDRIAVTDTQNMKVSVFDAEGALVDELRMDTGGMIHPHRWARLNKSETVLFHSTPPARRSGEMLHVYSADLTTRRESFAEAPSIWDQDSEFQVALTGSPHSVRLAAPSKDRVCVVTRVYEGVISCFERSSGDWRRTLLEGREIDDPYRMLDLEEYRSTPSLRRRAWSTSGPHGQFAAQVFSYSHGLFALEDQSLIHFASIVNAWNETEMYAELYSPDGTLVDYGPIRGYPKSKPGSAFRADILWYGGDGLFYVTDNMDGYPVVRQATIAIEGYEFTTEQ